YAGIRRLRQFAFEKLRDFNRLPIESDEEIVVSAGSTGAFVTAVFALLDAGDEVILFEPFYGYHRNIIRLTGASIRSVPMEAPDWSKIGREHVLTPVTCKSRMPSSD